MVVVCLCVIDFSAAYMYMAAFLLMIACLWMSCAICSWQQHSYGCAPCTPICLYICSWRHSCRWKYCATCSWQHPCWMYTAHDAALICLCSWQHSYVMVCCMLHHTTLLYADGFVPVDDVLRRAEKNTELSVPHEFFFPSYSQSHLVLLTLTRPPFFFPNSRKR